jgi:hypothetical protein
MLIDPSVVKVSLSDAFLIQVQWKPKTTSNVCKKSRPPWIRHLRKYSGTAEHTGWYFPSSRHDVNNTQAWAVGSGTQPSEEVSILDQRLSREEAGGIRISNCIGRYSGTKSRDGKRRGVVVDEENSRDRQPIGSMCRMEVESQLKVPSSWTR